MRRTVTAVTDFEGALVFAGIPLLVVAIVFALVFGLGGRSRKGD
jgi:hypothetical protein